MIIVTLHLGKLSKTVPHEEEILDFILYNRVQDNSVTSNKIIDNLWSIEERYQEKALSTLQKWWYRFMHRHFLTFRRNIHVVQNIHKMFR